MTFVRICRRNLEEFLHRHGGIVLLLAALFVIGVIFGALSVRSVDARDRLELVSYLGQVLPGVQALSPAAGPFMLKQALWGNFKLLLLMWALGISVVGALGIVLIALLRGLLTGFVVGFLTAELGWSGLLVATAGHVPQSLLQVPAVLLAGAASIAFSVQVFRSWRARRRVPQFYQAISAYSRIFITTGAVLALASLVEGLVSPGLVRWAVSIIEPF